MNKQNTKVPISNPPVNVALPNTTESKMQAISNLSIAVLELSKALNSVNVLVSVCNNVISGTETGINISTKSN